MKNIHTITIHFLTSTIKSNIFKYVTTWIYTGRVSHKKSTLCCKSMIPFIPKNDMKNCTMHSKLPLKNINLFTLYSLEVDIYCFYTKVTFTIPRWGRISNILYFGILTAACVPCICPNIVIQVFKWKLRMSWGQITSFYCHISHSNWFTTNRDFPKWHKIDIFAKIWGSLSIAFQ